MWKKSNTSSETLTRSLCVENIYPRILYAFSDILCYVINEDPRSAENTVTRMIKWAGNVYQTALNQPTLPRALLIFNNRIFEDGRMLEEKHATNFVLGTMERWPLVDPELRILADKWNEILPLKEKVSTMRGLLLRYFQDISVICIPPRKNRQSEVYHQFHQLRKRLSELSKEVNERRRAAGTQVSAIQLNRYLNRAFDHFFANPDHPFDFSKYSIACDPLPDKFSERVTSFMRQLRELEHSPPAFDNCLVELLSSYTYFRVLSRETKYISPANRLHDASANYGGTEAFGPLHLSERSVQYSKSYSLAYQKFHSSTRCWYRKGTIKCKNNRQSHVKGHQEGDNGSVFAKGGYYTHYNDEYHDEFIKRVQKESERALKSTTLATDGNDLANQHLSTLRKHKEYLKHMKWTSTCLFCIGEVADIQMSCGHTICSFCLQIFGSPTSDRSTYQLLACELCGDRFRDINGWTQIQVKPVESKPQVLAIDGGGVRSIISARILHLLEQEIGIGIPIHSFFDLVLGTSSGA